MTVLGDYELSVHWDGPTLYVECVRCREAALAHPLFTRPSYVVVGAVDPCIWPDWGNHEQVARFREWEKEWSHWEVFGLGNEAPGTFAGLHAGVIAHEIQYH